MKVKETIIITEKLPSGKEKVTKINRVIDVENPMPSFYSGRFGEIMQDKADALTMPDFKEILRKKRLDFISKEKRNNGKCRVDSNGKVFDCKIGNDKIIAYDDEGNPRVLNLNSVTAERKEDKKPKKRRSCKKKENND